MNLIRCLIEWLSIVGFLAIGILSLPKILGSGDKGPPCHSLKEEQDEQNGLDV